MAAAGMRTVIDTRFLIRPGPLMALKASIQRGVSQQGLEIMAGARTTLMILIPILLAGGTVLGAVAERRRKQAEALNLALTRELKECKRTADQINRQVGELEARIVERTGQLEAANKESEAFSYSVAHDLRAPLRHISGFSKILSDNYGARLDAQAQEYLRHVCDGAKNMGRLIDDLLTMGRIGRQELVPRLTDLNLLVSGVVESLQGEYVGRQIDWKIAELPAMDCDPALMKQVFRNLLSNAVKYTRLRKNALIEVGRLAAEGTPTIFIRDNGTGFDQRYAHKLFGVFQRLHTAEEFEGTGVGLATVQRIVLRHGGRIWADAEMDKGATFFFTLGVSRQDFANGTTSSSVGES
jgi:light-regulated signal transduction histidine kinase (bacteriophytochrome)